VLQAFVDDSGSATGDKRLFLAGYIHRIDHWVEFSNDWITALQEPPALKSLHMTKAFRGWSIDDGNCSEQQSHRNPVLFSRRCPAITSIRRRVASRKDAAAQLKVRLSVAF
jgi:hypothetical protein